MKKTATISTETETLIKDTAKRVFFADGRLHATTQDIADVAGINRASIHYYFRTREQLFDKVFGEAVEEMRSKMRTVFDQELSVRDRTERFVELFIQRSLEHPYLEMFIITQYNTTHDEKITMIKPPDEHKRMAELKKGIAAEVAKGNMRPISPEHFIITMMSLCSFPFLAQDILKNVLSLEKSAYSKLMKERKDVIMQLLFVNG